MSAKAGQPNGGPADGADGADGAEETTLTSDGRVPGRRGKATRQKLLDCTRQVLESGSYRDLKIVDIAREAGTSPATFYQYFPDVEAAIAALAQEMATEGAATLPALVREQNWKGKHAAASSEAVVRGFFAFWDTHRPLMRVIDLAAAEGNVKIRTLRMRVMSEFSTALAEVVSVRVVSGQHPADTDPMAVASVVVTLLVNVAIQRYSFAFYGISADAVDVAVVRMVHTALTGQKPARATTRPT